MLTGQSPRLSPLQNNGGSTLTHALLADSQAINRGNTSSYVATDQRGIVRPQGMAPDIGAYEYVGDVESTSVVIYLPLLLSAR